MKENVDKYIEKLVDKAMKDSVLESPSFDFTSLVMQQVTAKSKVTVYEPLISKKVWFAVFASVIALILFVLLSADTQQNSWFITKDFNLISKLKFSNPFSGFKLGTTTMYGIMLLSMMVCIQIPMLKSYFDKRLNSN
ncbi:hypothetical protein [Bizionia arctica]|uniref:Uncharacterized protein n=1 Tax=Bizionia arctica TaxID=1495645 RepID=A0A917GPW9_9FLAO|nr:hypothetical protein [Bizionia arctica]GGG53926.1 hypothetical protein GCM10010976_26110 [Bizionia arctica]